MRAFSAIIRVGESVLPEVIVGMIEASTTRRPLRAAHPQRSSTTARGPAAHLAVPTGWKIVVPMFPAAPRQRASSRARPGRISSGGIARKRAADDPPRRAIARPRPAGLVGREIVGRSPARLRLRPTPRCNRSRGWSAAGCRRRREGREGVQRVAELVQRQRLDVVFEVGRRACGSDRVKSPSWRRRHGHRPAAAAARTRARSPPCRTRLWYGSFSVVTPAPCRSSASAGGPAGSRRRRAARCTTSMPSSRSRAAGPMPESCRICGEPMAPAARIDLARAHRAVAAPPSWRNTTPAARPPSSTSRSTMRAGHRAAGWGGCRTGCRKALDAFQRTPRFWLTSK